MAQDSIELYFDRDSKSVFDKLIERIIKRANDSTKNSTIKFYNNGQYVYKYADILKEEEKLYIIDIMPWEELRKFWLKVIELTKYAGTYKAYTEILTYMFGEQIEIEFSSRTTDSIEGKEERQAGNLWIHINKASTVIDKFFWLTDEERRTLIAWKDAEEETIIDKREYPIYITQLININIDIINQIIDFLTPVGLRTYLDLTL